MHVPGCSAQPGWFYPEPRDTAPEHLHTRNPQPHGSSPTSCAGSLSDCEHNAGDYRITGNEFPAAAVHDSSSSRPLSWKHM
jgi:hypothetical protein